MAQPKGTQIELTDQFMLALDAKSNVNGCFYEHFYIYNPTDSLLEIKIGKSDSCTSLYFPAKTTTILDGLQLNSFIYAKLDSGKGMITLNIY